MSTVTRRLLAGLMLLITCSVAAPAASHFSQSARTSPAQHIAASWGSGPQPVPTTVPHS